LYVHFKPERFDDTENYEKEWITKYSKDEVKKVYKEKKKES
jgi:hypothetical protein